MGSSQNVKTVAVKLQLTESEIQDVQGMAIRSGKHNSRIVREAIVLKKYVEDLRRSGARVLYHQDGP